MTRQTIRHHSAINHQIYRLRATGTVDGNAQSRMPRKPHTEKACARRNPSLLYHLVFARQYILGDCQYTSQYAFFVNNESHKALKAIVTLSGDSIGMVTWVSLFEYSQISNVTKKQTKQNKRQRPVAKGRSLNWVIFVKWSSLSLWNKYQKYQSQSHVGSWCQK